MRFSLLWIRGFSYTQPHLLISAVISHFFFYHSRQDVLAYTSILKCSSYAFFQLLGSSRFFIQVFHVLWTDFLQAGRSGSVSLFFTVGSFLITKSWRGELFFSARSEHVCWKFDGWSWVGWLLSPLVFLLVCVCLCLCHLGFVSKSLWCM